MPAITIGRLDHQVIDVANPRRRKHQRIVRAPQVARTQYRRVLPFNEDHRRAENVTRRHELTSYSPAKLDARHWLDGQESLEGRLGITTGVQRKRGRMLREMVAVGVVGFFLLKVCRVE